MLNSFALTSYLITLKLNDFFFSPQVNTYITQNLLFPPALLSLWPFFERKLRTKKWRESILLRSIADRRTATSAQGSKRGKTDVSWLRLTGVIPV